MKLINITKLSNKQAYQYNNKKRCLSFLMLILVLLTCNPAFAVRENHSLEKIRLAAKKFLEEMQVSADSIHREIKVGYLDPRLQLVKCQTALDVFLPQKASLNRKVSVGIRCHSPVNWKIFVSASITEYHDVWVINQNLSKGEVITRKHLSKKRVALTDSRKTPAISLKKLLNSNLKRTMRAGSVIYQNNICLICKGEKVNVIAKNKFLRIHVEGVALNDAALGEQVQVRNASSKRTFDATVSGKNRLFVNLAGTR